MKRKQMGVLSFVVAFVLMAAGFIAVTQAPRQAPADQSVTTNYNK